MGQVTSNPNVSLTPNLSAPWVVYLADGSAIFLCVGNPEGVISANRGSLAIALSGEIYTKTTDGVATGWIEKGAAVTVPGSNAQVIFNDSGAFGASPFLFFSKLFAILSIGNSSGTGVLQLQNSNGTQTNLTTNAPAASIVIKLPDDTPAAGEFLKVLSFAAGTVQLEYAPATGISGTGTANQLTRWSDASAVENLPNSTSDASGNVTLHDSTFNQRPAPSGQTIKLLTQGNSGSQISIWQTIYSATQLDAPNFIGLHGRGTNTGPTATQSGDVLVRFEGWVQQSTGISQVAVGGGMRVSATENASVGTSGSQVEFYVSKNGGGGSGNYAAKFHNFGAFCIGANPTTVSATNKLLVNNGGSFASDVYVAFIADNVDTTNSVVDIGLGAGSTTNYAIRVYELGDGTARARVDVDGCWQQRLGRTADFCKQVTVWKDNATPTGNSAGAKTSLHAYALLTNSLRTNKDSIRIRGYGRTANNVNNKTLQIEFGTAPVTIVNTGAVPLSNAPFVFEIVITRLTNTTQRCFASVLDSNLGLFTTVANVAGSETLTSGSTLNIVIYGNGAGASDVIVDYSEAEFIPAN